MLNKFVNLAQSKNEKIKVGQLRALENKMNINVIMAKDFSIEIDKDDLMNYYKIMDKKIVKIVYQDTWSYSESCTKNVSRN